MAIKVKGTTVIDDNSNVVASSVTADEFIGTGDKLVFSPSITSFTPTDGATNLDPLSISTISLVYDQPINIGVGTITLRENSYTGTIAESFELGISTRATLTNQTLTIEPTINFKYQTDYYVVIPSGSFTNYLNAPSGILTTYNFSTESSPVLVSTSPGIGSTQVDWSENIILTYSKNISPGIGTITLRLDNATGVVTESYDVNTSDRLTFADNVLTIDPTSSLSVNTQYSLVVPDEAVYGTTGINTYNFTTKNLQLGDAYEGGFLICQTADTRWIVAPSSTEVKRTWWARNDAVTLAEATTGCTGWFVPSLGQLQNPGRVCIQYWDSYLTAGAHSIQNAYWSTSQYAHRYYNVFMPSGYQHTRNGGSVRPIRVFRTVSY